MASGDLMAVFHPHDNEPPSSSYASLDLRNMHPVLDFDGSADEEAVFSGVLPANYGGGGLTVRLLVAFTSATSGTTRWQAAFERMQSGSHDLDLDSFAAFQSASLSVPSSPGEVTWADVAFTDGAQMDSLAAGEAFRLKVRRDADGTSGTDDAATDAELAMVAVVEA